MAVVTSFNDKPFGISQIKAYIPIKLDMIKLNYQVWRELFETHCISFGVLGHIDGSLLPTPDTEKEWKEHDGLVKMWIYGTISDSILETVLTTKCTARDLWLKIENLFRDNKEARALQIENELRTIVIGDLSIHDYCNKLKTLSDLLANLDSPVPEKSLVMHLLNGLSEKFDNIINVIKHKVPFPSFLETRSMLSMEEDRLSKHVKPNVTHNDNSSAPTVLYTTSAPQQQNSNNSNTNNGPSNSNNSYNNNNNGGSHRGNRGRGRGGRNNRGRGRFNNWNSPFYTQNWQFGQPQWSSFYQQQPPFFNNNSMGQQRMVPNNGMMQPGLLGPRPDARITNEAHSIVSPSVQQLMLNMIPANLTHAFNTMSFEDPSNATWYFDTGATNHIASDQGTLRSTVNTSNLPSVIVGNGSYAPVTKLGQGVIPSNSRPFHLRNVLVCPSIIKNLISVRKFVTDNFCSLEFDPFGFSIKDLHNRKTLLRCNSQGPLYPITPPLQSSPHLALFSSQNTSSLWHRRLGHPSDQVLQRILSSLSLSFSKTDLTNLCHACQLG